ncbi:MAG: hypothetical protein RMM28_09095, partial [Thermoleophilia bacterium]|nr:hypothetical protein [Gaiellaceae bacterium]MDW8339280.1 hypothetical protein [Thermoleophilia bacterium]
MDANGTGGPYQPSDAFGLTMPFSGGFSKPEKLRGAEERPEPHPKPGERVRATLLAIDDGERGAD